VLSVRVVCGRYNRVLTVMTVSVCSGGVALWGGAGCRG